MTRRLDKLLAVTVSGVRPGEDTRVRELLASCRLHVEDISTDLLRHFIVARRGDRLLGVVGVEVLGKAGLLRSLAVEASSRHQGIATKLVVSIEKYAKSMGIQTLYLLTLTADAFFSKMGFRQTTRDAAPSAIKETAEFKALCPDTAVCMCKDIAV